MNKARVMLATGLPSATIDGWIPARRFPKPIKFGTHRNAPVRWRWCDIQAWIAAHEAASGAGKDPRPVAAGAAR